jgi:hypothetical protein
MQFKAAEGGNATMLIWLGKQYLGQSDKTQHELSGPGGGPIEWVELVKVAQSDGKTEADA